MGPTKERPILFTGPMVRAILNGRKTQTRRLVKWQKPLGDGTLFTLGAHLSWAANDAAVRDATRNPLLQRCPYGAPGDRLWVRETWAQADMRYSLIPLAYRADGDAQTKIWRWRPSIHMPRWASRITLEVTDVRVERLQDISEADARAEGLDRLTKDGAITWKYGLPDRDGLPGTDDDGLPWADWSVDARKPFAKLWDRLNGERAPWSSNPWVWVVGFRHLDQAKAGAA